MSNKENNQNEENVKVEIEDICDLADTNLNVTGLAVGAVNTDIIPENKTDVADNSANHTEVEHSKSDDNIETPPQEELSSLADQAQELSNIEPVAGEEVVEEDVLSSSIAQKLAQIEPEAGNVSGVSGGGYGFQSNFEAQGVIALNDVGPIDPTALEYGIEFRNDELGILSPSLQNTPILPLNPVLEIGNHQVYEDGQVAINAFISPESSNGDLEIIISGIPSGWTVSDVAYNGGLPVGTGVFDAVAGTWTITVTGGVDFTGGPVFTPPADSDVDLTGLVFNVSEIDPTTGQTGFATDSFNIIVDAVADAPDIDALDDVGNEGDTLDIDLSAITGEEVNNGAGLDDGSENITGYQISGVPAGFTLSAGVETAPNSGVYDLTPAEIAGLTITPTDPNYSGSINLVATVFTTENPVSDADFDLTNNNAQDSDQFTLTWKPEANPPTISVNQGVDDVLVKEDNSIDVPIEAALDPAGSGNEILTVTVTGIDSTWGFSSPVGTYDSVAGTWTITLAAGDNLNTVFTFTPPADSDIDLTGLVATASAYEPSTSTTANSSPDSFNIIVDAVADAPDIDANGASGEEGTTIPLTITTSVNDVDGSEVIEVIKITNVPDTVTLTAGSFDIATGVWSLTPADLVGLGMVIPDGMVGNFVLNVESVAYEQNTNGIEVDLTDNRSSAFSVIKVQISADDIPVVTNDEVTVDESNLAPITSVAGSVVVDFGADNPGTVDGSGAFDIGGATSGGEAIIVTFDASANTYTGSTGTADIFTLVIQPNGDYEFTLQGVVDHPDVNDPNDSLPFEFGVVATDADGDTSNGTITVNVLDDGPYIHNKFKWVDETDLVNGTIGYTKTLDFDFGQDGAGSIDPTGKFVATFQVGGAAQTLTSGGLVIDVVATADGYVGSTVSGTVFTVVLDSLSGEYTYTQFTTIDHPGADDNDDVIWLKFEVQITDADGDTDTAIIGVDVRDDGPVANDDCVKFNADDGILLGNVTDNDVFSQDADNTVTQIKFGSDIIDVPADGSDIVIHGDYGVLTINSSGEYTYDLVGGAFSSSSFTAALNPVASDVAGIQSSLSQGGITVSVANAGNFDISWVDTAEYGSGLGIDNLDAGDSKKVWPKGETFDIAFDQDVSSVSITIAEIGENNNKGNHGVDYVVTLADGTTVVGEQQFVPGEIIDGTFKFTLDSSDFGGQLISSIDLNSTNDGQYKGASFLLNNVEAEHVSTVECVQDIFEYVLTDGDGDTSSAQLKIKAYAPNEDLIIGQNVDDVDGSIIPHLVNGDEGIIDGGLGNDILVGDAGGSFIEQQTQDYNFVFMLDVSGSMGNPNSANSKITLLKDAVENILTDISTYGDGQIKVHLVPFASSSKPSATFTITTAGELADLSDYLDALSTGGYTNYEDPMQDAIDWLQGGEPFGGNAITTTYFISDGQPNRYVNNFGEVRSGSTVAVMGEITGSDGSDEVAILQSLSNKVIAVGLNIGANISNLDVIDSSGSALNIDDPSDLTVALAGTNPLDTLVSVGSDVIEGGDGNDIIFGDVLFTDDIATLHGLTTDNGAGWEVFERLENGESSIDASWTRADTIEYIRSNSESLSQESVDSSGSGRDGGNDVLYGGAGNDIIFGQEGDDVISGGLGDDIFYGGSGADVFLFSSINDGVDTVKDFDVSQGDILDLSLLLSGYDSLSDDIADFVIATEVGGNTVVSVDQSGNSGLGGTLDMVLLEGITGLDLDLAIKTDVVTV